MQAYRYGYFGFDMSEATASYSYSSRLTEEQRNTAYSLGRANRKTDTARMQAERAKYKNIAREDTGTDQGNADRTMARENTDIPYQMYRKLLNKKPLKDASRYYSKVKDARIEKYRTLSDGEIPDIDFLEIAEYKKVNEGYVYTIRNYDKGSFAIIGRRAIKTRYDGYVMEVESSGKTGKTTGNGNDGKGAQHKGHEAGNRVPGEQGTLSEDADGGYETGETDQGRSLSDGNADNGRRGIEDSDTTTANMEAGSAGSVSFRTNDGKTVDFDSYMKKDGRALNERQSGAVETMKFLSQAIGAEFVVYESYVKNGKRYYVDEHGVERESAPNGWYDPATGKIYVDLHAGNTARGTMLYTMAHELTHFIAQWSPEKFKALADIVFRHSSLKGTIASRVADKMARAKAKGRPISFEVAQEEVVADAMESVLKSGKVVEFIADVKQQDAETGNKLVQWFKKLVGKIKKWLSAYNAETPDSYEGKAIAEMQELLDELEKIFAEGLLDAGANFQAAEKITTESGGVMYMSRNVADVTEDTVRLDLTEVFNGHNVAASSYIPLAKATPFAVRYITGYMDDLPIIVDKKKAYFDMRESGKFKEDSSHHYHGMGVDGFLDALAILEDPEYAIQEDMGDGKYHYAFISSNENGEELCVVFQMNVTKNVGQMNGFPGGYYNLDITEFVATDEWLEEHGVEPGTSYKDYLLSFSENSIAYDRSIHREQLEKARIADSESAGLAASYDSNRAFKEKVTQPEAEVKKKDSANSAELATLKSERDYSYDALVSKPDMVVTTVDGNVPGNRADVVSQAKKNAAKVGKYNPKDGSVSVCVNDIDTDVVLGTEGLKHGLDRRFDVNAVVTLRAGEILQNSIRINELTPQKPNADASYVLIGAAKSKSGDLYIVRSVVNRFSNELASMDVLYAINTKKGNRLRSMRPGFQGPVTDSTISIAELLDYVNQYFPDVLPEEVLKHYGHDARPEGKLGESALYQERGYGGIREVLAKKGLDELSKRYGSYFPLSASFDATIKADNTPLVMKTVVANSVQRKPKETAFKAGRQAFANAYGIKTSVHIKQMGIDADLFPSVAGESIAKAIGRPDEQSTLDVIPHIRDILGDSILMGVERIAHTDNKGTALYGYRLYNLYWYRNGKQKTPNCLVCTVVQDLDKAEGYVFQNIENVTVGHGLPGNKTGMPTPSNGNAYTISQLYRAVKKIARNDGGLKYTDAEKDKYLFSYTERNDGTLYQERGTDESSIDTAENSVYDDNKSVPVYLRHQPGQDLLEFDHDLWKQARTEAANKFGLTKDEAQILYDKYVGGDVYNWNLALLGDPYNELSPLVKGQINLTISALKKFPTFTGRTYRNLDLRNRANYDSFLRKHKVGSQVILEAFAAASKDPNGYVVSGDNIVHLVIDGFTSRDIADSFSLPGQQEVVYLPGSEIQITSIMTANDGYPLIYAQEVNTNGKNLEADYGGEVQSIPGANREGYAGDAGGKRYDLGGVYQDGRVVGDGGSRDARQIQHSGDSSRFGRIEKETGSSQESNLEIKRQERTEEATSNRSLLANALENAVTTDTERQKLADYRTQIARADELEQKLKELLEELEKIFAEGLLDAGANFQAAEKSTTVDGGVRQQARVSAKNPNLLDPRTVTEADVRVLLENVRKGMYDENTYIPVRISTPGIIQERLFAEDFPMAMPVKKVRQAFEPDQGAVVGKNVRGHGLSVDDLIYIIEHLDSPDYLFSQKDGRGIAVLKISGNTAVVVEFGNNINTPYMNGFEGGKYNISITAFDIDGGDVGLFVMQMDKGWTKVFDKQKEGDPAKKFQATRPFAVEQDTLTTKVTQSEAEVKKKDSSKSAELATLKSERDTFTKAAVEHFGRTYSWKETGYLLTDGGKLDFSGRHEGASGGYRSVDHREILDIYPEDTELDGNGAMVDFMRQGNIRIMPEGNGINLQVRPTKAQENALSDFISKARGEVTLDIDDANGNTVISMEYPRGTHSSKILQDIRNYFETGAEPVVSTVAQFRYQERGSEKTFKNGQNAKGEFVANVLLDLADSNSEWWTGRYNRGILGMNKTDDTEFRQFYQEILKRTKDMDKYGVSEQPVLEDSFDVQDGKGKEYIYVVKLDGYLHGVVVGKIDKAKYEKTLQKETKGGHHGESNADIKGRIRNARTDLGRDRSGDGGTSKPRGNVGYGRVGSRSPGSDKTGIDEREGTTNRAVSSVTTPNGEVLRQERTEEATSNRSLLANALENAVTTDTERQKLADYRAQIARADELEQKLKDLNAQIRELSFANGKRDTAKIRQLRDEAIKTANRILLSDLYLTTG